MDGCCYFRNLGAVQVGNTIYFLCRDGFDGWVVVQVLLISRLFLENIMHLLFCNLLIHSLFQKKIKNKIIL